MRSGTGRSSDARALQLFLPLLATTLFWWTATDRLDLPKLCAGLVLALIALAADSWRRRAHRLDPASLLLAAALALVLVLEPAEMAARVEGWAGWVLLLSLVVLARGVREKDLAPWLARLALCLAGLAWLQALGLSLFNAALTGFEGRRVVGCLGGPGQLGWILALLLPWLAHHARLRYPAWGCGAALALVAGALVLSGARTAWIMAAAALPLGLGLPATRRAAGRAALILAVITAGVMAAVGLDALGNRARLTERIEDLGEAGGTARGRVYLWRVHLSAAGDWLGLGHGPESFQRRWPAWQNAYLDDRPQDKRFRSDLRHAHADLVEVGCDLGLAALLALAALLGLAVFRPPPGGRRWSGPALGTLAAALAGGLAAPLLFFAPAAALAAAALGVRLGPPRGSALRGARLVLLGLLLVTAGLCTRRLWSEVERSAATAARAESNLDLARKRADRALEIDGRNPRAWIERALVCRRQHDAQCACHSVQRAAQDLPNDAVTRRLQACRRRGRWWQ